VTAVLAGPAHNFAVLSDGTVWGWGDNRQGQLGREGGGTVNPPVALEGLQGVKALCAGGQHSGAIKADGSLVLWGAPGRGRLGPNEPSGGEPQLTPLAVPLKGAVKQVGCGDDHNLALLEDGTVWAWGRNDDYQLGVGRPTGWRHRDDPGKDSATPVQPDEVTGGAAVAAAGQANFVLTRAGKLLGWGHSMLTLFRKAKLYDITGSLQGIKQLAGAPKALCVLLSDGNVWCRGECHYVPQKLRAELKQEPEGAYVQMPTQAVHKEWVQVAELSGITHLAVGPGMQFLAVGGDGRVWIWGNLFEADYRDGGWKKLFVPEVMQGLSQIKAVASGRVHSLALDRAGTVWAWGINEQGQLGTGTSAGSDQPVKVIFP
jgi:alpha-tubulin suppressor-like RCC1 family protein